MIRTGLGVFALLFCARRGGWAGRQFFDPRGAGLRYIEEGVATGILRTDEWTNREWLDWERCSEEPRDGSSRYRL